ncbi:MAG: AAA family ATPase [Bacteroidaceae bacterium]|nr:AAA family ATPase [Bacteroidaceae bacterium]
MTTRRYPVGIQTFSEIVRGNYIYVDKTELMWQLAHYGKYIFMSRPRRFEKSLLTSTLESYFCGEKELFEGLKVMELEQEWASYPVIHLDLSMAKNQDSAVESRDTLMWLLKPLTLIYGHDDAENSPGKMLTGILQRAYQQAG